MIESYCFEVYDIACEVKFKNYISLLAFCKILLASIIPLTVAFLLLLLSIQISKARFGFV